MKSLKPKLTLKLIYMKGLSSIWGHLDASRVFESHIALYHKAKHGIITEVRCATSTI